MAKQLHANGTGKVGWETMDKEVLQMKKLMIVAGMTFLILLVLGINCSAEEKVIYGCYQKQGGELRIVTNNRSCRPSENAIFWNQTGPQGPQGIQGPQGPQGIQGPAGPAGDQNSPTRQDPRVYDGNQKNIGIFPSTWDGLLSFFIPDFSKFLTISPRTGDVDPNYPQVYLYYDGPNCSGNSYIDADLRYQVLKFKSSYLIADDVPASCLFMTSVSMPRLSESGEITGYFCLPASASCTNVLTYKTVTMPFDMPVVLPLYFQ